jgi:PST family polysaccharide transporter
LVGEGMEMQTLAIGTLLLGFGWVGEWVVPIVFGARWLPLFDVYPYIALSYLTTSMFNMHTASLSVLNRNWYLALYQGLNVAILIGTAFLLVPRYGMTGYGFAELATLSSYLSLHILVARTVGSPDYRMAALWWAATAIALFWRQLGVWTAVLPFIALAMPASIRRIRGYILLARRPKAASARLAEGV